MRKSLILLAAAIAPVESFSGQSSVASRWAIETSTSKMDDSPGVILTAKASAPIVGWVNASLPQLSLRCQEGHTEAYVVTGMAAHPELGKFEAVSIRYRIDDLAPVGETWNESTDSHALFSPRPRALIDKLAGAHRFRFEFTPFNSSPTIAEFLVDGLSSSVGRLAVACRWRYSDSVDAERVRVRDSAREAETESRRIADSARLARQRQMLHPESNRASDSARRIVALGRSVVPLSGWTVSLDRCSPLEGAVRCTVSVTNTDTEKKGFRLESVRTVSRDGRSVGVVRDFKYSPRFGFAYENTEGMCEPSKACLVQFTIDSTNVDRLTFSLSLWSTGFGTRKEKESDSVSLSIKPTP